MGRKIRDFTGQKFGRLTVIEFCGRKNNQTWWKCQCECGNLTTVPINALTKGRTKSCGCLKKENMRRLNYSLNHKRYKHGKRYTRLYGVWRGILKRCNNSNRSDYKYYGAKGVQVYSEWHDFQNFYDWAMENGYDPNAPRGQCTIDRIDPFGDYEPSNCRWVSMTVQNKNKRKNTKNYKQTEVST